jgi:hypothetical protein
MKEKFGHMFAAAAAPAKYRNSPGLSSSVSTTLVAAAFAVTKTKTWEIITIGLCHSLVLEIDFDI